MAKKKKKQKLPKGISILLIIIAIFYSLYEKDIDKTLLEHISKNDTFIEILKQNNKNEYLKILGVK